MTPEETAVCAAMKTFKGQADACVTSLYAYLTIHAVLGQSRPIRNHVNKDALFWNTVLYALQSALILALGRAFETNTPHNVATFMRTMKTNRAAFSRASLRNRIAPRLANNPTALEHYVRAARIPYPSDFRRVADFVSQHREAYQATYRDLRHELFAHTLTTNDERIAELFSKTNIRQLQRMTTYLVDLHDAFWEALNNGGRLRLRRRRYSIARILKRPKGRAVTAAIQETVVSQTMEALQPWTLPPSRRLRRR
jgi:AbiU2